MADVELTFDLSTEAELTFDLQTDQAMSFDLSIPHDVTTQVYDGDYEVTPKTYGQTLETANKKMADDVTINAIPYFETSNESDGKTVYIANTIA